jgi:hypothetical protein
VGEGFEFLNEFINYFSKRWGIHAHRVDRGYWDCGNLDVIAFSCDQLDTSEGERDRLHVPSSSTLASLCPMRHGA